MPRLLSWGSPPSKSFISSLYLTFRQKLRGKRRSRQKVCPRGHSSSISFCRAGACRGGDRNSSTCRRLPGRGQELLHVPAHGGVVLLLPPRLLTLGGQRRPPFFIRVWDGLACRLGRRFKALHALRSPPETRAPASNFDCSGKGPEQRKISKRVLACCAC